MATTFALRQMKFAGTISGNAPQAQVYQPTAAATIHAGDVTVFSSGTISVSATPVPASNTVAGLAFHGAMQGTPWYLVNEDLSSGSVLQQEDTGGTFGGTFMAVGSLLSSNEGLGVHIIQAVADNLFMCPLKQAIGYSAVGVQVGIVQDATTKVWYADSTQATKSAIIVMIPNFAGTLWPEGPANPIPALFNTTGDLNAPVIIRWLAAASAFML